MDGREIRSHHLETMELKPSFAGTYTGESDQKPGFLNGAKEDFDFNHPQY